MPAREERTNPPKYGASKAPLRYPTRSYGSKSGHAVSSLTGGDGEQGRVMHARDGDSAIEGGGADPRSRYMGYGDDGSGVTHAKHQHPNVPVPKPGKSERPAN